MAKHLDDLTDNSFESMRQPVQLLKVNELPDRLMHKEVEVGRCLLYTSPSPRDRQKSRMPSSA